MYISAVGNFNIHIIYKCVDLCGSVLYWSYTPVSINNQIEYFVAISNIYYLVKMLSRLVTIF